MPDWACYTPGTHAYPEPLASPVPLNPESGMCVWRGIERVYSHLLLPRTLFVSHGSASFASQSYIHTCICTHMHTQAIPSVVRFLIGGIRTLQWRLRGRSRACMTMMVSNHAYFRVHTRSQSHTHIHSHTYTHLHTLILSLYIYICSFLSLSLSPPHFLSLSLSYSIDDLLSAFAEHWSVVAEAFQNNTNVIG